MLNDTQIKNLKAKEQPYKVFDGDGLYLHVTKAGKKYWRIKYRQNGKESIYSVGEYPAVGLRAARQANLDLKARLAAGEDIRGKTETVTFRQTAEEWHARQIKRWSEGHAADTMSKLERFVFPRIGDRAIEEITPPQVLELLRVLEGAGKLETASKVQGICSLVFRYGVACGYCQSDPCRDLKGAIEPNVVVPRAAITDRSEIGRLMVQIREYPSFIMKNAMLWSAYTFCRPGEVRRAEWSEIDIEKEVWIIPAEKMKMRREHRVPLVRQTLAIVEELKKYQLSERWLFPSTRAGKCLSEAGVLSALRGMGYGKEEMCAHGFRAMASTQLNEMGYRPDLIETQLAHGDKDKVRAAYNRAEYWEERKAMTQAYADFLDGLAAMYQGKSPQPPC